MMGLVKKDRLLFLFSCLLSPALVFLAPRFSLCAPITNPNPVLRSGDLFPKITFTVSATPEERKYLGIGEKKSASLEDIKSDVLVIKYLNTNCIYCIKLLPTFNEIYQAIDRDANMKARIKILGIGAGDSLLELNEFKKAHLISYPTIPDSDFRAHKAAGEPRVPFIVVVRKDRQNNWVVATVNVGLIFSAGGFIGELKAILATDPDDLRLNR